jgi:hypothetical protein
MECGGFREGIRSSFEEGLIVTLKEKVPEGGWTEGGNFGKSSGDKHRHS